MNQDSFKRCSRGMLLTLYEAVTPSPLALLPGWLGEHLC